MAAKGLGCQVRDAGYALCPSDGRLRTVVCIASGPSLTPADVERVRIWREKAGPTEERQVFVANTTFRLAPWADAMFAMDRQWWQMYHAEVNEKFQGLRYSSNPIPVNWHVKRLVGGGFKPFGNSGAASIAMAVQFGFKKVIMLGFDCQHTGGKTHWHGSHPKGLGDAGSVNRWPEKFKELKLWIHGRAEVINASRVTALDMFPRQPLEEVIEI